MIYDINGNVISAPGGSSVGDTLAEIGSKIISGEIKTISLIGDSITDGGAGTGYNGSGTTALSTNTAGYCWANMLKAYLLHRYGTVVTNYGQYGSTIAQQYGQFATTIPDGTDLVIWLTGTNNRNDTTLDGYANVLKTAINAIMGKAQYLVVMDGIPARQGNEDTHTHSMADIADRVIPTVFAARCAFLPMYNRFTEWIEDKELVGNLASYYDGYGIHPNDAGYHIMLQIILREFGIPVPYYDDLSVNGGFYPFA